MFHVLFVSDFFFSDAICSRKQPEETKICGTNFFETGYPSQPKKFSNFLCDNFRRKIQLKVAKC